MPNFGTMFQNLTGTNPNLNYQRPGTSVPPAPTTVGQAPKTVNAPMAAVPKPVPIPIQGRNVSIDPAHLPTLRNTLFAEISNRDPNKQQLEARTIINTMLNRMQQQKGKSLQDIITAPKQYQGYGSKEYQRIVAGKTTMADAQKLKAIDAIISELKSGKFADNIGGSAFYTHKPDGRIIATSTF